MHWIRIMDASGLTVLSLLFHLPKWKWDWGSFKLWGEGYSGQSIPNPHQRLFLLGIRREAEERVMLRVQLQWCSAGPSSIFTLGRLVRDSEGCGLKRGLPWTHLDTICCTVTCMHLVIKGTLKPQGQSSVKQSYSTKMVHWTPKQWVWGWWGFVDSVCWGQELIFSHRVSVTKMEGVVSNDVMKWCDNQLSFHFCLHFLNKSLSVIHPS